MRLAFRRMADLVFRLLICGRRSYVFMRWASKASGMMKPPRCKPFTRPWPGFLRTPRHLRNPSAALLPAAARLGEHLRFIVSGAARQQRVLGHVVALRLLYALAESDRSGVAGSRVWRFFRRCIWPTARNCDPMRLAFSFALSPSGRIAELLGSKCMEIGSDARCYVSWSCLLYTHYWGAFVCLAGGVYGLCAAPSMKTRLKIVAAGFFSVGIVRLLDGRCCIVSCR